MVFQRLAAEELVFFNSAIQPCPCQGAPAYEEAEADALATSPRPGMLGNTQNHYIQMLTQARDLRRTTNTTDTALQMRVIHLKEEFVIQKFIKQGGPVTSVQNATLVTGVTPTLDHGSFHEV